MCNITIPVVVLVFRSREQQTWILVAGLKHGI
uniref:Uncharacterized protein n=1 Tax=Arundo donax TaxID=35708 RepID=A0A0A8YZB9_ARUDO